MATNFGIGFLIYQIRKAHCSIQNTRLNLVHVLEDKTPQIWYNPIAQNYTYSAYVPIIYSS
jgi:hypothetical protein